MKRIISLFISVMLVMSCFSVLAVNASATSAMSLSADKTKASIGEIVTVSVSSPAGLSGLTVSVRFDPAYLSIVSSKATNLFSLPMISNNNANGRVGFAAVMNESKVCQAGVAFTVTFKVLKTGASVSVNVIEALDVNNKDVSVSPASLTIKPGDKTINFPDVNEGDWFYEAVEYCAVKGYITGYNNGLFGPGDIIKRQDFVLIFARINGADLSKYAGKTGGFKDVEKNSYYAAAVAWGAEKGIITGYNSSTFGVGDPVTREQVCTIIYRYMSSPDVTDADAALGKFSDRGKISGYAVNPMAWCVENGVISGKNATTVAPLEGASRAQIATIIMRMDKAGMFSD